MARESRTRTHLENLVIIPTSAHGDADGDNALQIFPINSDDISGTPTAAFRVDENGNVYCKTLTQAGSEATPAITGTSLSIVNDDYDTENTARIWANAITTGSALEIFLDTDLVTTGKAINVISGANYAAATSKFSVNDDGNVIAAGTLDVTGNTTLVSLDVGGGSGGSGATITALGAGTFDAALTADTLVIGGGYASSGLSVANTGALTCASTALFDGAITSGKVGSAGSFVAWGTTDGSIAVVPIAAGTNLTTIQNQTGGSAKVITLPSATCTLPGLGLANAFTAVQTITVTGVTDASLMGLYSNVNQTTLATANDLTAVRGNARIDVDSASGKAIGGYFVAGNTDYGFNLEEVRGIYVGTMCKTPTAANKTHTNVKGIEIVTGNTALGTTYKTDVTNLYGIRLRIGSSTGQVGTSKVCGDITNGYGVWVDHEQQGDACRVLDAGFYLSASSISGGNAAWAYGLDMSAVGANMGTADIRLSQGETIDNLTNGTVAITGKTTVDFDASTVAAGANGLSVWIGQDDATALTGTLRGAYIQAVNGDAAATGTVRGIEVKAKGATDGGTLTTLTGALIEADPKNKNTGTQRGIEVSLAGDGGTQTLAQGVVIFNNSSGTQTSSYALDINGGTLSGHQAFTAEIRFSNGLAFFASADAITANSTATALAAGSLGITSNGTGVGHLFVSDGSKWQYCAVA